MKLSKHEWIARGQAYHEAAGHLLQQSWTDDRTEMEQAIFAAAQIQRLADSCFEKGERKSSNEPQLSGTPAVTPSPKDAGGAEGA